MLYKLAANKVGCFWEGWFWVKSCNSSQRGLQLTPKKLALRGFIRIIFFQSVIDFMVTIRKANIIIIYREKYKLNLPSFALLYSSELILLLLAFSWSNLWIFSMITEMHCSRVSKMCWLGSASLKSMKIKFNSKVLVFWRYSTELVCQTK